MLGRVLCDSCSGNVDNPSLPSGEPGEVQGSILSVKNIPTELIQKIAYNCTSLDYANLRQSSKFFSEKLESFEEMKERLLEKKCTGEVAFLRRRMLDCHALKDFLCTDKNDDIFCALKNIRIVKGTWLLATPSVHISVKYPRPSDISQDRIHDILSKFYHGLELSMGEIERACVVNEDGFLNSSMMLPFYCIEKQIGLRSLFYEAESLFDSTEGDERYLLAVVVSKLKDYLCEGGATGLTKDYIVAISSKFPGLFKAGSSVLNAIELI